MRRKEKRRKAKEKEKRREREREGQRKRRKKKEERRKRRRKRTATCTSPPASPHLVKAQPVQDLGGAGWGLLRLNLLQPRVHPLQRRRIRLLRRRQPPLRRQQLAPLRVRLQDAVDRPRVVPLRLQGGRNSSEPARFRKPIVQQRGCSRKPTTNKERRFPKTDCHLLLGKRLAKSVSPPARRVARAPSAALQSRAR